MLEVVGGEEELLALVVIGGRGDRVDDRILDVEDLLHRAALDRDRAQVRNHPGVIESAVDQTPFGVEERL